MFLTVHMTFVTEVAERWNSCMRLSCLQHGYTVHTSFDMVPPHPKFLPSVQLKFKDWVVLNAGNFLHMLHVTLENRTTSTSHRPSCGVPATTLYHNRLACSAMYHHHNHRVLVAGVGGGGGIGIHGADHHHHHLEEQHPQQRRQEQSLHTTVAASERVLRSGGTVPADDSLNNDADDVSVLPERRVLTDRDREWEIFISNVPPRSSLPCLDTTIDTDSEVETYANDTSCTSDTSLCTVKDISLRFDVLKHGDIKANSNKSPSDYASIRNLPVACMSTRSKSAHRLSMHHTASPCDLTSYNDDSDDSTICLRVNSSPSISSHKLAIADNYNLFNDSCSPVARITRSRSEESYSGHEDIRTRLRSMARHSSDGSASCNKAENEYDFVDEIAGSHHEKLSVFRKRRLADKTYEFSDENSENVPAKYRNYRRLSHLNPSMSPKDAVNTDPAGVLIRSVYERLLSPHSGLGSPSDLFKPVMASPSEFLRPILASPSDIVRPFPASPNDVLRPINQNISSPLLSPRDDRSNFDWDKYEKVTFICALTLLRPILRSRNKIIMLI